MRNCPFYVCGKEIPEGNFACRHCWAAMGKADREKIAAAMQDHEMGRMPSDQYEKTVARVLHKYQGDTPAEKTLIRMCQRFMGFMALMKEYGKTPDGNLEKKKKLRAEVKRLGELLEADCEEIIHPKSKQPKLFDPGEKPQGPAH